MCQETASGRAHAAGEESQRNSRSTQRTRRIRVQREAYEEQRHKTRPQDLQEAEAQGPRT